MKFRHEYKHCINLMDIYCLRTRLSAFMKHDKNAGEDGKYIVKSLYFDNYLDQALREKVDGVNKREKFRIRYYGTDTSFIRLEKKSKINGLCNKESVCITKEECLSIIDGNIEFMRQDERELVRELYSKMKYQLLRPKCIVAYTRESFVYPPGNVRVTLDSNIGGSNSVRDFLNPETQFLCLYKHSILEVKWDEFLPEIIRNVVGLRGRKSTAFSKYAAVRF